MRSRLLLLGHGVCILLVAEVSLAKTREPYVPPTQACNPGERRVVIAGASLDPNWERFPYWLQMDFAPTQSYEQLNVTLPVYVHWLLDTGVSPNQIEISPPQPITSFDWWSNYQSDFVVQAIGMSSADGPNYYPCPSGTILDSPRVGQIRPIDSSGYITIQDIHGGTNDLDQTILIQRTQAHPSGCEDFYCIVFAWSAPGVFRTYFADHRDSVRASETVLYEYVTQFPEFPLDALSVWTPVYIVQHVSTDIAGASPGIVDAADLAALGAHIGHYVNWGWYDDPSDPLNGVVTNVGRTYHANVNPYSASPADMYIAGSSGTTIDSSDLAVLAHDIGKKHCTGEPPRKGVASERVAILDWFGLAPTGRMITPVPGGESIPEIAVVDPQKMTNAISDPYGYRRNLQWLPAQKVPWSTVKRLYR